MPANFKLVKSCQIIKSALRFERLGSELTQHGANARRWGCYSINIKLGKINCPEARSVNFHTLSPISLKVEVLNQIKPGQCTMELCTKWHSYAKRQPLLSRQGNFRACLFPPRGSISLLLPSYRVRFSLLGFRPGWRHAPSVHGWCALNKVSAFCRNAQLLPPHTDWLTDYQVFIAYN